MRLVILYILIFIVTVCTDAQTVQLGVVKEYNEKAQKTPLSGVVLNVRSATSTVSDKNGTFSLEFLTLKVGDKINVRAIEKSGYEIFNKEALEQWILSPGNPFTVIMCRSDKFRSICENYYNHTSDNYKRQYKKEIAKLDKLKADGKVKDEEYRKMLSRIQKDYDRKLDNLQNYVDRFARIDLSELNSEEQTILELVQNGHFEEAINRYNELRLEEKYIKGIQDVNKLSSAISSLSETKESIAKSNEEIMDMLNRQIETLLLAGGTDKINTAIKTMKNIADVDSLNVGWLLKTGLYIQNYLSEYDEALQLYQKAYDVSKRIYGVNHPLAASSLNNIGGCYYSIGDYSKSLDYYQKALEIKNKYFSNNLIDVADSYNNVGSAYHKLKRYDSALSYYEKAVEMQEDILGENNFKVALSYNNIGALHMNISNHDKALYYFEKSLKIRKSLGGENHETVGESYNNLGWYYDVTEQYDEALESYYKSLYVFKERYGEESLNVANVLNNIGIIFGKTRSFANAAEYYLKSLDIKKKVLGENHINVALSFQNLGDTYNKLGKYDDAIRCAEKEISIRQNLSFDDSENLSFAYLRAGDALQKKTDNDKARYYFNEAYKIRLKLFGEKDFWINELRNNKILFP